MKKNNLKQILSTSLSLALMATSVPMPAGAIGPVDAVAPAFVAKLTPPEQFGYVATSYAANGEAKPRLIVIADLHAHLEVQQHIEGMLDFLVKQLTSGKESYSEAVAPIFVEGGWSEKLEHPLSRFHNPELRSTLAKYFMAKAEMPASQAYSEMYPEGKNFTLTGVENYDEYQANRDRFVKTYPERKRVLNAIARHEQAVNDLVDMVEPGVFTRLQGMRQDYLSGKISAERYTKGLIRMAARFNVTGTAVDTLKNSANIPASQLDLAFHSVHKAIVLAVAQDKPLSSYFRKSLGDEARIRENLALIDTYLDLLKRTLSNQLTPEEVPLAYKRISEMAQVANLLIAQEGLQLDMVHVIQEALAFYPFAIMRDTSLVENSLKALEKNPSQTTGILVAGGFHIGTISDYLRSHKVPFMVIHPVITRDLTLGEQINYVKRMAREHVTLDELRADFANGFGRKTESSGLAAQPIGNTSTEPLGQVNPKDPKGGAGAFGATEDALLAALHNTDSNGNPLFVSKANGLTVADGVVVKVEDQARIDAVAAAVKGFGFFEAKIGDSKVAAQGATFSLRDGSYEGTGQLADDIRPIVQVALKALPDNGDNRPATIHVQAVSDDVFLKLQETETGATVDKQKDAIILGIGTKEQVVIVNQKYVPNAQAAQRAVEKLNKGTEMLTAEDNASLQNMYRMSEEIAHGLGNFDATQGHQVDVARTGIFLGVVAKLGGTAGVEHSATGGLSAVQLPTRVVNGSMRALAGLTSNATPAIVAEAAKGVANVSLGSIIGKLQSNLDINAQRTETAQILAKSLEENFPNMTESRRNLIISQAMGTVTSYVSSNPAMVAKVNKVAAAMDKDDEKVGPEA